MGMAANIMNNILVRRKFNHFFRDIIIATLFLWYFFFSSDSIKMEPKIVSEVNDNGVVYKVSVYKYVPISPYWIIRYMNGYQYYLTLDKNGEKIWQSGFNKKIQHETIMYHEFYFEKNDKDLISLLYARNNGYNGFEIKNGAVINDI
ncbi:hypothetical protein A9255_12995 [Xenorhabdus hominickii]|uniref:Uncharacterized protein n=3 Tax=Xenorhabdus hominickii TaxID=351679 RepID=A0ABM6DTY4_XENHO|nr:hypothetical protein A9255_12995 [Xenorhabdus hominickii]